MRTVKFDGIRVAEITVSLLEAPAVISAKAAFVNTKTGTTHGWTTCKSWSKETVEKLKELRDAMERDLAATHFEDGAITSSPTTASGGVRDAFQGLGEHLGAAEEPVPQV